MGGRLIRLCVSVWAMGVFGYIVVRTSTSTYNAFSISSICIATSTGSTILVLLVVVVSTTSSTCKAS